MISSVSARSHVLLAFWTVVLFNLPFWWYSTSIERLPLPVLSDSDRLALEAFARSASQAQDRQARDGRVTKYAPHWRLAFTLLLEDIVDGSPPLAWEIESGIADVFSPLLEALEQFHTFSIESSIQYHAPLLVTPVQDNSSSGWLVGADDAKAFVNSEAWSLGSYGVIDEPTLQFMVFVPRASRSPLAFERTAGGSSRSILIPQQGSLVIHTPPPDAASRTLSRSDLHPVLQTHLQALSTLLGIPSSSSSSSSSSSGPLSSSQLSTLLRQRSAENIIEATQALGSLTRLIDKISEMRVGPMVQEAVKGSVAELEAIARSLSSSSSTPTSLATLQAIFSHSARALQLSSSAFFHPSMLGLLYFPDEHKYAVYTPLFAPVGVPLVVALVKEIKRRKKEKREREKAASEKEKVDGAATTAGRIDAVPI